MKQPQKIEQYAYEILTKKRKVSSRNMARVCDIYKQACAEGPWGLLVWSEDKFTLRRTV